MKIQDIISEIASFVDVTELEAKAKNSKITTDNNNKFNLLVNHYMGGYYDEDIELFKQRLGFLL